MMFFCALMALITSALMLLLLCEDLHGRKVKASSNDRIVDGFLLVGFVCSVVVSGHSILASFH